MSARARVAALQVLLPALAPLLLSSAPVVAGPPAPSSPGAVSPGAPAPAAPAPGSGIYERDVVEVTPAAGVRLTTLTVDNRLGNVRVEGHDRPAVVISALKRAPDPETLERLKVTLIPDPNGPVRVSTAIAPGGDARPIPGGAVQIDLVVRAPRSVRVRAQVWNGRLALVGMENGAELVANDGDIEVQNASGTIVTHSAGGKQQFVEVFGKVDAQAIHGDMDLAAVRGERLDASVHEGSIAGRQVRVRHAWLRTIRGDIHLEGQALAGGQYRIASVRGDIDVALMATAPITIAAHAPAGTVTLPPSLRQARSRLSGMEGAVVGSWPGRSGAPAVVELRSRIGNIRLSLAQ